MMLADVRGEKTLDLIAALIPPIARIAGDPAAAELLKAEGDPAIRAEALLPDLIRGHKRDLIEIFAALRGQDPRDYELTLPGLLEDLRDLMADQTLTGLFT